MAASRWRSGRCDAAAWSNLLSEPAELPIQIPPPCTERRRGIDPASHSDEPDIARERRSPGPRADLQRLCHALSVAERSIKLPFHMALIAEPRPQLNRGATRRGAGTGRPQDWMACHRPAGESSDQDAG